VRSHDARIASWASPSGSAPSPPSPIAPPSLGVLHQGLGATRKRAKALLVRLPRFPGCLVLRSVGRQYRARSVRAGTWAFTAVATGRRFWHGHRPVWPRPVTQSRAIWIAARLGGRTGGMGLPVSPVGWRSAGAASADARRRCCPARMPPIRAWPALRYMPGPPPPVACATNWLEAGDYLFVLRLESRTVGAARIELPCSPG